MHLEIIFELLFDNILDFFFQKYLLFKFIAKDYFLSPQIHKKKIENKKNEFYFN